MPSLQLILSLIFYFLFSSFLIMRTCNTMSSLIMIVTQFGCFVQWKEISTWYQSSSFAFRFELDRAQSFMEK